MLHLVEPCDGAAPWRRDPVDFRLRMTVVAEGERSGSPRGLRRKQQRVFGVEADLDSALGGRPNGS